MNLHQMTTEKSNPRSEHLDSLSIREALTIMNQEDHEVAKAVKLVLPEIEQVIQHVIHAFQQGGRLIYIGAGTSGRIGLMDAVECPPTFGTPFDMVRGLIAGGDHAFISAVEGAEDSETMGVDDLKRIGFTGNDVLIGIAASGRTPYVIAAMHYARSLGSFVAAVSNNKNSKIGAVADVAIEADVGPEVLTGSTRLKAGSSQKMILNMISTLSMVGIGKAYKNYMVDVLQSNKKLQARAVNMICAATGAEEPLALRTLSASHNQPKVAIVMILLDCDYGEARDRLAKAKGFVRDAIKQ
jgi:N-acetylmuramic acid 6-phosphate etherase